MLRFSTFSLPVISHRLRGGGLGLIALGLLSQLGGCTVLGPDYHPPQVTAPAQWRYVDAAPRAASASLPADRWAVFQDARLLHLQALARASNQDVQLAAVRLMQARMNQSAVTAQRGPHVDAVGSAKRQRPSETGNATRMVGILGGPNQKQIIKALAEPYTLYQAGFDASWEPDLWGRMARSDEAAQASSDAQAAQLHQVQLSIAAEVARAYFQLQSVQAQQQMLQGELTAAQDMAAILSAQRQAGMVDESALNRQQTQVASLQAALPALAAQAAQWMSQLALLCAAPPGELDAQLRAPATPAAAPALPDLHLGLPSELARHRPDIAAAEANLHAATARIGLAQADLYPRIVLGASFGLENVGGDQFGEWGSRQWSVGPSFNLPLFDRGRRHAIVHLRELQQQEAAIQYQQVVLKAWHEVDDAMSNYLSESARSAHLAKKVQLAKNDAALANNRYRNGLSNYLPVSATAISVLESQRELADHQARLQVALTALYKALGDDQSAP